MNNRNRWTSLIAALAVALLAASGAQAMTMDFGGADDPSLKGTTGSLTITETATAGTFDAAWQMKFDGYLGSVGNHQYLTHIALKAFNNVTAVSYGVDGIEWTSPVDGALAFPSNVNNGGCKDDSKASMICVTLDPMVDATQGGTITANFVVTGDLLDEWSYRGKFGTESGWVISESSSGSSAVPEPSAALVFGAGLIAVGSRFRGLKRQ
jgi:hypothetical protein